MICPKCGQPVWKYQRLDERGRIVVEEECGCGKKVVEVKERSNGLSKLR